MLNYLDYRSHLDFIIRAALKAADPAEAVRRHWPAAELANADRLFIVGAGKAGVAMAAAAAELLGPRLTAGVMAVPDLTHAPQHSSPITFILAGHPRPDAGSLRAGEAIAQLLTEVAERDVVLALVSGGGSALLELPVPGVTLTDLQTLNDQLLRSGAPINELNCVRKHLSQIKGGGLARLASPARVLSLILSDVIGDPLDVIASGLIVPDPTTIDEARSILGHRKIISELAEAFIETPKPGDPIFARVTTRLIGSNTLARMAAAQAAQSLGFTVELPERIVQGEAREWGAMLAYELLQHPATETPQATIYGGESTVAVRGNGRGGRNQELVLAAALALDGAPQQIVIASFGTDGVDGPTPAAGALVSPESAARARASGLNPIAMLEANDSYTLFEALGDCLLTGPTGTNVNDLVIGLRY